MKLKKLITLAIALVLTTAQALAASPDDLLEKLKTEKSFVLEAITGYEGNDAGKHPAWKQAKKQKNFYVTDCNGKCKAEKADVLSALKKFAKDYNQTLGREYVVVDSHITSGSSNRHTRFELSKTTYVNGDYLGYFSCRWNNNNRIIISACRVQLALNNISIKKVTYNAIHEAMNTLGIFDTPKLVYQDCVVYDPEEGLSDYEFNTLIKHRNKGYQGLCEIEKRAIVFLDKYIKIQMRKYQVAKAFDKHWVSDTTLALDKIDPNWKEKETEKAPKKAITKKIQQGGNK